MQNNKQKQMIDLAIMPSFECNLKCWFCMYDCGPDNKQVLDYEKTKKFLSKVDWGLVNACGFYGGEPSINMELYQKFIDLIPGYDGKRYIYRFTITNGSWSLLDREKKWEFVKWCINNYLQIIISSTPEHIKHQDRMFLESYARACNKTSPNFIVLKEPDEIHAQGRAKEDPRAKQNCEIKCQDKSRNIRLGLKPDGNVVFQNCHGEYHIVQTYEDEFDGIVERVNRIVEKCLLGIKP